MPANPKLLTAGESGDHENTKERKHETMNPDSFFVFSTFRVFVILRFPGATRIGGQSPTEGGKGSGVVAVGAAPMSLATLDLGFFKCG